jgi:hypothetical protein
MIQVNKLNDTTYEVTVTARSTTTHTVTLTPEYARKLTGGAYPTGHLVERSFDFLLERESNTSILRNFELSVIGRYFPEYERTIKDMLQA